MDEPNNAMQTPVTEVRHFHCTTCPSECSLSVEVSIDGSGAARAVSVQGNRCKRGRIFAEQEITRPMPIPRDLHMRAMDDIRHARVTAPVRMGDVVMSDLLGTGVDLVASMDVAAV